MSSALFRLVTIKEMREMSGVGKVKPQNGPLWEKKTHSTWAKTHYCKPERYYYPRTEAEIRGIVLAARTQGKRIQTVGAGHSPSKLTMSNDWIMSLDKFGRLKSVDLARSVVTVEAGMRLYALNEELDRRGLALANIGSISDQSVAGAFATATHGSTLSHGLLSQHVLSLSIMLSDGSTRACSKDTDRQLFDAALVSLGGLGIIISITLQLVPKFNLHSVQTIYKLESVLSEWEGIWNESEFVRVWWFPYCRRCMVWKADKTDESRHKPRPSWYAGTMGYYLYKTMLLISNIIPTLQPAFEKFIFSRQYGWDEGARTEAVERSDVALNMDCLYSQFVNEWALPLDKGVEAISRLDKWLSGDQAAIAGSPSPKAVYVHSPIEVRVSNSSADKNTPMLDFCEADAPTLFINATLYRPYLMDPPCLEPYYEAFEILMREYNARPHWAKNWRNASKDDFRTWYPRMAEWLEVRERVDKVGMFASDWLLEHVV